MLLLASFTILVGHLLLSASAAVYCQAHPSFTVRMMQTHCFLHLQQTADIKSFFFIANVLLKRSLMLQFALGFVAVFPSIAQSGLGVNLLEHPLLRRLAAVKNVCHVLAVE